MLAARYAGEAWLDLAQQLQQRRRAGAPTPKAKKIAERPMDIVTEVPSGRHGST